jgi:hypothetical protein
MTTDPQQPEPPSIPPAVSPDGVSIPIAAEKSPIPEVAEQKVPTAPADPASALPESPNTTDVVAATSVVIDTAHPPVDVLQAETSGILAEAEAAMRLQSGAITRVREKMVSSSNRQQSSRIR